MHVVCVCVWCAHRVCVCGEGVCRRMDPSLAYRYIHKPFHGSRLIILFHAPGIPLSCKKNTVISAVETVCISVGFGETVQNFDTLHSDVYPGIPSLTKCVRTCVISLQFKVHAFP